MLNLSYYLHLLLNSRYKTIIHIFVVILFFITVKNINNVSYCMTEDTIPTIAESKDVIGSNLENKKATSKEVSSAISSMTEKIAEQQDAIRTLKAKVSFLDAENQSMLDRMYGNDDPDDDQDYPPLFTTRLMWGRVFDDEID